MAAANSAEACASMTSAGTAPAGAEAPLWTRAVSAGQHTALLFTQHLIGLDVRKANVSFLAEALAELGWDTRVVTTQLSLLSFLARTPRLSAVPTKDRNRWRQRGERLWNYVWLPVIHPASMRNSMVDFLLSPFYRLYPFLMPKDVRRAAADARLILIESGAGLMLVDRLRRIAPRARLVYNVSDRVAAVGFHRTLVEAERRSVLKFDLVRVCGRAMLDDFGPDVRKIYLPHGLDKRPFDAAKTSPYRGSAPNVVIAGDMGFDTEAVTVMARSSRDVHFHLFGRMPGGGLADLPNVYLHGEVSFEKLVPYIKFADVGAAPYTPRPDLDYLVDSSMKLVQYRYCRLPIITPQFAAAERKDIIAYDPLDADSITSAVGRALTYPRDSIGPHDFPSWREVAESILGHLHLLDTDGGNSRSGRPPAEAAVAGPRNATKSGTWQGWTP